MDIKLFYKDEWFINVQNPKLLMKFYSSIGITESTITHFFNQDIQESFLDNYRVLIRCGYVTNLDYSMSKVFSGSDKNGTDIVCMVQAKKLSIAQLELCGSFCSL